jgi:hypothetical protein
MLLEISDEDKILNMRKLNKNRRSNAGLSGCNACSSMEFKNINEFMGA